MAASEIDKSFADPPPESRMATYLWSFGPPGRAGNRPAPRPAFARGNRRILISRCIPTRWTMRPAGFANLPYLSPEFLDMLGYLARRTKEKGMEADLAMGSGWPYGGPHIPEVAGSETHRDEDRKGAAQPGEYSV